MTHPETATFEEIRKILEREIAASEDVAKIVIKPNKKEDVLTFLNGTLGFRRAHPEYPSSPGSGDVGRITRLIGGLIDENSSGVNKISFYFK